MGTLSVSLFGKFTISWRDQPLPGMERQQIQGLFSYLLLNRSRPQRREVLASLFWQDCSLSQAKKYLRKALWRLQSALEQVVVSPILLIDTDWVQVNEEIDLWLDVAVFEEAYNNCRNVPGWELSAHQVKSLQAAVDIYQADLLEGRYEEWCLYERGRFQYLHQLMLQKLLSHCEATGRYEAGLDFAMRSLRHDPAQERSHRALMRLYFFSGNRTAALRQFESCCALLYRELGVRPTELTVSLYEQIRDDQNFSSSYNAEKQEPNIAQIANDVNATLPLFKQLEKNMARLQRQVNDQINLVEHLTQLVGPSPITIGKDGPIDPPANGHTGK